MPLFPMLMNNDYVVPRGAPKTLERLLGLDDDYPSPTPFSSRRQVCSSPHRKYSTSTMSIDKNTFQVTLDVQQFTPEELFIKSFNNNVIQVEGKHEERQDEHGLISRHFIRKFTLPKGHDTKNVTSTLSSDRILTIISRKRKHRSDERKIPIKMTGQSEATSEEATNETENPEKDEPNKKKKKKN